MKFKEMPLATALCQGVGIEFGAAAHNPFNLPQCRNVAPSDGVKYLHEEDLNDYRHYVEEQKQFGQGVAEVHLVGDMQHIPVDDASLDYVISSHVIEHEPNPIKALLCINSKLTDGGIAFFVLPKRNQVWIDAIRPLTTQEEFIAYFIHDRTVETAGMRHRTHYCVYSLQSFLDLVAWCNRRLGLGWAIEAIEETDSKVGNGHTAVFRKSIAFSELGASTSSEKALRKALKLLPDADRDSGIRNQALMLLRVSLSLDFMQPEAFYLMAGLLIQAGLTEQSKEFMRQALVLQPENGTYREFYYQRYGEIFSMPVV